MCRHVMEAVSLRTPGAVVFAIALLLAIRLANRYRASLRRGCTARRRLKARVSTDVGQDAPKTHRKVATLERVRSTSRTCTHEVGTREGLTFFCLTEAWKQLFPLVRSLLESNVGMIHRFWIPTLLLCVAG